MIHNFLFASYFLHLQLGKPDPLILAYFSSWVIFYEISSRFHFVCNGCLHWSHQGCFILSPGSCSLATNAKLSASWIFISSECCSITFLLDSSLLTSVNASRIEVTGFSLEFCDELHQVLDLVRLETCRLYHSLFFNLVVSLGFSDMAGADIVPELPEYWKT